MAGRLCELLARISGLDSTYVIHIDWSARQHEVLFVTNAGALDIPEGLRVDWTDPLCKAVLDGGPTFTNDAAATCLDSEVVRALGIRSHITVPIQDPDGALFGSLCGASTREIEPDEVGTQIMQTMAEMISMQLAIDAAYQRIDSQTRQLAEANASLERLALTDPVTGLSNRRQIQRELTRVCSYARRRHEPVSVIRLDIEGFRNLTDSWGQGPGDEVLGVVAERLRQELRTEDVIGRLTGGEFVIILAGTNHEGAELVRNRLFEAMRSTPAETGAGPISISARLGLSTGDGWRPEQLLRESDADLYRHEPRPEGVTQLFDDVDDEPEPA